MTEATGATTQRVDKWLWYARFAKTRSLAGRLCQSGGVRLAGEPVTKPNRAVRVGDLLTIPQGRLIRTVRVAAIGARRGPPAEARHLYEEVGAPAPRAAEPWIPLLGEAEWEGDA
jgi:ribosome-associated heat shock protein Hsp15